MDIKLTSAYQQPNLKFDVEEFTISPQEVKRIKEMGKMKKFQFQKNISALKVQNREKTRSDEEQELVGAETATVKVESVGMSSADQPIPDYSAYFSTNGESNSNEATLILEPDSKAISGNDGTSVSMPMSRALLRKGAAVKFLYRPQSVAISGSGGISHAQSDLIIDFIDE
jgi:hypothetical protein